MAAPADLPFDLDTLPPTVREAFVAMQAKVAGLEAQTERQDYLIAELRHALYGKRSEQLPPDARQLAFEDLEAAVAEAEAARDELVERNADGRTRRPAAKRNLDHFPGHLPRVEQVIEPAQKICPCGCIDMVAQLEARRKAGLSTSDPTHACSGAISNSKPDCEEMRDLDKRSLIIQKKENELDPDTQLEKRAFVAAEPFCHSGQSRRSTSSKRNAAFHYRKLPLRFFSKQSLWSASNQKCHLRHSAGR
jgi:hypothetical protein